MKEYKVTLDNGQSKTYDNVTDLKRQLVFLTLNNQHYRVYARIKAVAA